ncbi:hypothetical protein NE686_17305 [Tissierella carlieri]|uniref:Uncharacterized protein n=1 Tax=Tissierella carlieri TaxID=689904 RepID=A0ABT1SEF1_9FIRM|nr:hypothetical protein [Tissierella carlieri]MCQ4924863.1 hypothetical protein [Tissierella carlieri]
MKINLLKNEKGISGIYIALLLVVFTSLLLIFLTGGTEATKDKNLIKSSQETTNTIIKVIKDVNSTNN